ncbi:MAG: hypothetical protein M3Y13_14700 [Armatimonadota bacterium]|nr:hypothetical protein [Armatimonadota bacterium]
MQFSRTAALLLGMATLAALGLTPRVNAQTYNLAADWSDTSNPNGVWQYGTFDGTPSSFTPFPDHVSAYINVGPPAFSGNQPAWTDTLNTGNNGSPEGLAKSVGNALSGFDFPVGRVGGHTPASSKSLAIQWTAPAAGTVDLSGGTWMWQDIGRVETISLFDNGTALFQNVAIPSQASGVNSSKTFTFAQAIVAGGGSLSSLSAVPVAAGDKFVLSFARQTGSTEYFVGADYTVKLAPAVPEASSLVSLGLGLLPLGLMAYRKSRRRA